MNPPTPPTPTRTTSARSAGGAAPRWGSNPGIGSSALLRVQRGRDVRERLNAAALGHRIWREVLLGAVLQPDSGMAEEAPAELVAIAAVGGIAEQPLLQMRSQELEERTLVRHDPTRDLSTFQFADESILCRLLWRSQIRHRTGPD